MTVDGDRVFSKKAIKRHAAPGEIAELVAARIGPQLLWAEPD